MNIGSDFKTIIEQMPREELLYLVSNYASETEILSILNNIDYETKKEVISFKMFETLMEFEIMLKDPQNNHLLTKKEINIAYKESLGALIKRTLETIDFVKSIEENREFISALINQYTLAYTEYKNLGGKLNEWDEMD